jgi:hypothetical protein
MMQATDNQKYLNLHRPLGSSQKMVIPRVKVDLLVFIGLRIARGILNLQKIKTFLRY